MQQLDDAQLVDVTGGVFGGKKGYDHYAAKGAMASAGANVNPTYEPNAAASGSTAGVFDD